MPRILITGDVKYTAESAATTSTATAAGTVVTVRFNVPASTSAGTAVTATDTKTNSDKPPTNNRPKIIFNGKEYLNITYNGMVNLPNDILSMLFGKTYELNKIEYKKLCDLFEKGHDSNFNTVKFELTPKDLASLSRACKTFYNYIGGRKLLQLKIRSFALKSTKLTPLQLKHIGSSIIEQAIMKGEVTVGKAISNTHPHKITGFTTFKPGFDWEKEHLVGGLELGLLPHQVGHFLYSRQHFTVLKKLQKLKEELKKAKVKLRYLILENKKLKADADNNKKQREQTLKKSGTENKEKIEEENKKLDAAEPKKQMERDRKEKEAHEKYAKQESEFKEFENIFAYEKIKGLNARQVDALLLGLLPTQLKGLTDVHILMLEEWKQEKHSAEKIRSLFEKYKKFNVIQIRGLKAGFSENEVSEPWFSQISIDGVMAGFSRFDVAQAWFSETHATLASSGFTVEQLRGLSEDKAKVLRYGYDRKSLLEIKPKIEGYHLKALEEGCSLIDVCNLDSEQCEVLIEGKKLGFDAKTLFDRKAKVELFHLEAVKNGYKLDEVILLQSTQCKIMIACQLKPKDLIGLNEIEKIGRDYYWVKQTIAVINNLKIHPKEYNEFLGILNLTIRERFDFNKLFNKCSFAQAKKLTRNQLLLLGGTTLTYEEVVNPNYAKLLNHPYTIDILSSSAGTIKFKDLVPLNIDALFLLKKCLWSLKEVQQMDKRQLYILRKTHMSSMEYHRLNKIAQEHKLNSDQLIAMSPEYNLTLEQVKIPNFTLELAIAVQRGAKFDEARELNEIQLRVFNYCNDPSHPLEKHITIQQAKKPWISPLFLLIIKSGAFSYKEIEGLDGPQLAAFLTRKLKHSKEKALNNPRLSSPPLLLSSEANSIQRPQSQRPWLECLNLNANTSACTAAATTAQTSTTVYIMP